MKTSQRNQHDCQLYWNESHESQAFLSATTVCMCQTPTSKSHEMVWFYNLHQRALLHEKCKTYIIKMFVDNHVHICRLYQNCYDETEEKWSLKFVPKTHKRVQEPF